MTGETTPDPTSGAVERYRQLLSDLAELSGEQGYVSSARRRDRLVDEVRAEEAALRESAEGRAAITGLLDDPRPAVRLWAASAAVSWDEQRALPVLSEIREDPTTYGLYSISAKHRMLEVEAGRADPASPHEV